MRVFSGIQPSGDLHLGNYLGALRRFVDEQHENDSLFCIVDLHALTLPHDAKALPGKTLEAAAMYVASGLDPGVCTLFVQSHVPEHTELAWLMECNAAHGELSRMTQFKDKSARGEFISAGLFTYPALMAADILLYDTDRVPVGDDQRQHLEFARDVAERFNARFGQTFVVPEASIATVAARVMDFQNPTAKMSKSVSSPQGTVLMLDDPKDIERKIKRAVTDTETDVRYDVEKKPGVSNLLAVLSACTGEAPEKLAERYEQYGSLKADTAAAVVEVLRPVQERYRQLIADEGELRRILAAGAAKAQVTASATMARARAAVGLLPHT
jgi:tryptophanyl-tRNA synthetase